MKFHGMNMKGSFKCQSVVDASALVWVADDESRVVYDETTELIWVASDAVDEWKNVGNYSDFPVGTEMWFYESSAPTGWNPSAVAGDELLAVKGSGTYTTGGTVLGAWGTPAHAHSLSSHAHAFSGVTGLPDQQTGGRSDRNDQVAPYNHTHNVTGSASGLNTNTTAIDGVKTDYRPESSVGLICIRL